MTFVGTGGRAEWFPQKGFKLKGSQNINTDMKHAVCYTRTQRSDCRHPGQHRKDGKNRTGGFVIMDQDKKQVYFFGDSIVAQDKKIYTYPADYNQNEIGTLCEGYPTILERLFDFETYNFARGGQGISQQKEVILSKDFSGADLVIIGVGVNDFSAGKPIGQIPDSTEAKHDATFTGEYCTALDYIYQSNPLIKVILMTPLHRCTLHRKGNVPVNTIDTRIHGNTLKDYAQAIIQIGAFYSCPVADLYGSSGMNRFNLRYLTFEGVHPTNAGYRFCSGPLVDAVKRTLDGMKG